MGTEPRVHVCTGCGIGEALDIDGLCASAEQASASVASHPFLCSQEGVASLTQDGDGEDIQRVVIAAC